MPIYEFECNDCKQKCEILVRSKEIEPACPKCGGKNLSRLLSPFAAHGGEKQSAHNHGGGCSCCPSSNVCPNSKF